MWWFRFKSNKEYCVYCCGICATLSLHYIDVEADLAGESAQITEAMHPSHDDEREKNKQSNFALCLWPDLSTHETWVTNEQFSQNLEQVKVNDSVGVRQLVLYYNILNGSFEDLL